jgi:hypothetical protein
VSYDNALYDDVHKWTYVPTKKIRLLALSTYRDSITRLESYQREVRMQLRQSERFIMTDDFIRMAYDTSLDFEKVPNWLNLARLPYKHVWIEHDQWVKVEQAYLRGHSQQKLNKTLTAQRGGWLMRELDEDSGLWHCARWEGQADNEEAYVSHQQWLVAPEGNAIVRIQPPAGYRTPFQVWPELTTAGITPAEIEHLSMGLIGNDFSKSPLGAIENRVITIVSPLLVDVIAAVEKRGSQADIDKVRSVTFESYDLCMQEDRGLLRLLITTLALMNEAPNVRHLVKPKAGYRYMGMNKLPYLGHSTVTLTLPKSKPLTYLTGLLDKKSAERRRNRAHMTRGHWRCVEYGNRMPYRCDHNPTLVEKGVGICTKCERMIRWIPAHQRGDAALGWVTHDYVLDT